MSKPRHQQKSSGPFEAAEIQAAAREAAAIGGRAGDEDLDPAQRPLVEAGEGEAEGFELAEQDLIEAAAHGDSVADPLGDAFTPEREPPMTPTATAKPTTSARRDSSRPERRYRPG